MANVRPATARDGDAVGRVQFESWRAACAGLLPEEAVAGFDIEARQATVAGVAGTDARHALRRTGQRALRGRARRRRRVRERRWVARRGRGGRALHDLRRSVVLGSRRGPRA